MITTQNKALRGLILKIAHREAGRAKINGEDRSWTDADQIYLLPWETEKVRKYNIDPDYLDAVFKKLEPVHYGALIELTLSNKKVVSVDIVADVMESIYNNEEIDL